ncbi:Transcriptional activator of glycolytic enzyme [Phytophthora infestans]|uniref:Transcriptional activator of glycolytic enzyme n=1 Tax=Phytophthora infestans TaxID=4787 RepID=A0A8S9V3M5_PHYIN|nr:Transcriptional activator of glycolytic enzyme [Phytophthora infestans]
MENPADQRLQKAMSILKAKLDGAHLLIAGTAILQVKLVSNPENSVAAFPSCSSAVTSKAHSDQLSTSHYKMRRGLESVKELWEEWDVGVDGGAPVRELEERYGTKWCDADERRLFNRRRSVLNFIQQLSCEAQCYTGAGAEVATQLAVQYLDDSRKMRRKTLNWLSKNIALIHDEVKSRLIARISLDQTATRTCINRRGQPL